MTSDASREQRARLLDRLLKGEIDRATYDDLLVEIERQATTIDVAPPPSGCRPASGLECGPYRLEKRLGRGGMGEAWKAEDLVGQRAVVLKFLRPELQDNDVEMERVKNTFRTVHALQHQHICPVYQLGRHNILGYYLVMKYIEGESLDVHRRAHAGIDQPFPLAELIRLLRPVADALDYAHTQKVVHRDVKPSNIMVTSKGQDVQVIDFGLAAEVLSSVTRISRVRMDNSGTYPYMAPEQWRGQFQDGKTDQYALGVVAYELLAGRLPFAAIDAGVLSQCVLNEPVPPIEGQSAPVNAALAQALAKRREERFDSCRAFIDALVDPLETNIQGAIDEVTDVLRDVAPNASTLTLAQICDVIEVAISHGAPIYNQGQHDPPRAVHYHAGCARIYLHTQRALLARLGTGVGLTPVALLAVEELRRAANAYPAVTEANANEFAWTLRGGFDTTLYLAEINEIIAKVRDADSSLNRALVGAVIDRVLERGRNLYQRKLATGCAAYLLSASQGLLSLTDHVGGLGITLASLNKHTANRPAISPTNADQLAGALFSELLALRKQLSEAPAALPKVDVQQLQDELRHTQALMGVKRRLLQDMELKEARAGSTASASLHLEIEDLRAEIAELQGKVGDLQTRLGKHS